MRVGLDLWSSGGTGDGNRRDSRAGRIVRSRAIGRAAAVVTVLSLLGTSLAVGVDEAAADFASDYRAVVMASNPVSYWRLGESSGTTAVSETGVNNGTIAGGPTLGVVGVAPPNTAMTFDGTNDYINVGSASSLKPAGAFSIETWFKAASTPTSYDMLYRWRSHGQALRIQTTGQVAGSFYAASGVEYYATSPTSYVDGEWHHAVTTRNGSSLKLYIDGAMVAQSTVPATSVKYTSGSAGIGRSANHSSNYLTGSLDEFAFYAREVSPSEVSAHYLAGLASAGFARENLGKSSTGGEAGDPVNSATGNFVHQESDLVPAPGVYGMELSRSYNSFAGSSYALGPGWSTSFDVRMVENADNSVSFHGPDGRVSEFASTGPDVWAAPPEVFGTLARDSGSGALVLGFNSGERWTFDVDGSLVARDSGTGSTVTILRDGSHRPTVATAMTGSSTTETLTFTYDSGTSRLIEVETSESRQVTYAYAADTADATLSTLRSATKVHLAGASDIPFVQYTTALGRITEVSESVTASKVRLLAENVYDSVGRVVEQTSPDGDVITFAYDTPSAGLTTVTSTATGDSTVYAHQGARLIGMTDPLSASLAREWTDDGQLRTSEARGGTQSRNVYDVHGRLKARILPDPATGLIPTAPPPVDPDDYLAYATSYEEYTYVDEGSSVDFRVESIRDPSGRVTRYEYDTAEALPNRIIDAYGTTAAAATTRTYGTGAEAGLVVESSDADGVATAIDYHDDRSLASMTVFPDPTGDPDGDTTSYETVQPGDPGWTETDPRAARLDRRTTPLSEVFETVFDAAGRPIIERTPLTDDVTILPKSYTYFHTGELASATDEAGRTTSYDLLYPGDAGFTETNPAIARWETVTTPESATTIRKFDKAGDLVAEVAPSDPSDPPASNTTTAYAYGPLARLEKVVDATGRATFSCFDDDGRVVATITGPDAASVNCTTPGAGYIATRTVHDKRGRVTAEIDGAGLETRYRYDDADRVAVVLGPADPVLVPNEADWPTETTTYDDAGRVHTVTDPGGGVTTTTYTAAGRKATVTGADGLITKWVYDDAGRVVEVRGPYDDPDDPNAPVSSFGYDASGRRTTVEDPTGAASTIAYDELGRAVTETDPAGVVVTRTFHPDGELHTETSAPGTADEGVVTFGAYRSDGQVLSVTDANTNTTTYAYSTRGDRVVRTNAESNTETWAYDTAGRLVSHTDELARVTAYGYDDHGRQTVTADPSGRTTTITYDGAGRTIQSDSVWTDPDPDETRTVTYGYDAFGRRAEMVDPGGTTAYAYDDAGRLLVQTAPGGRISRFTYDPAGRRTSVSGPDGTTLISTYDPATGLLDTVAPGQRLTDTFTDIDGAPVDQAKWDTAPTADGSVTHHANTARLAVDDAGGAVAHLGNIGAGLGLDDGSVLLRYRHGDNTGGADLELRVRDNGTDHYRLVIPNDTATAELWRHDGSATQLTTGTAPGPDAGWHWVRLAIDASNISARFWNDSDPEPATWSLTHTDTTPITGPGDLAVRLTRDSGTHTADIDDLTVARDDPEGPLVDYGHDKTGRVTSESLPDGDRTFTYTDGRLTELDLDLPDATHISTLGYDNAGRINQISTGSGSTTYAYDDAGQLTAATDGTTSRAWTYDSLGRRTSASVDSVTTTYGYDDADQLTGLTGATPASLTWDGAGRLVEYAVSGGDTVTHTYDPAGSLQASGNGAVTVGRDVAGEGTLRAVTGPDGTTHIDWDATSRIRQLLAIDTADEGTTALTTAATPWAAVRVGVDEVGAPTDPLGNLLETTAVPIATAGTYDPYGQPDLNLDLDEVSVGYRGELAVGGLVHLRNRDYDPTTGSFTTPDPLDGVDGTSTLVNPYQYADHDPVNKNDPLGLRATDCTWEDALVDKYIDPGHNPGSQSSPFCAPASSVVDDYIDAVVRQPETWDAPRDGYQRCSDAEWAISVRVDSMGHGGRDWAVLRVEPSGWARWSAYPDRSDGGDQPWKSTQSCAREALAEVVAPIHIGADGVYRSQYYCHAFGSIGIPGTDIWLGGPTWDLEGWRGENWDKWTWVRSKCTW
jgi:RHS repeat-associated protein